jgi:HAD superfamily hydrolase (TIGR01509 family)
MSAPEAVLFDFSGTLMRVEPAERWLSAVLSEAGIALPEAEVTAWARRLEDAGGLPGGRFPAELPDGFGDLWERRDLDPAAHRAAYTGLIRHSAWPWPDLADVLYDRSTLAPSWTPYPDARSTLESLAERGIRTGLISNIGWNPRPVLEAYGMAGLIDAIVVSCEEGRCKPDPELFSTACARLGADPRRTFMVGDDRHADAGGEPVGIRTFFVDPLPAPDRPDGFAPMLAEALKE